MVAPRIWGCDPKNGQFPTPLMQAQFQKEVLKFFIVLWNFFFLHFSFIMIQSHLTYPMLNALLYKLLFLMIKNCFQIGVDALFLDITSNSAGDHFLLRVYMHEIWIEQFFFIRTFFHGLHAKKLRFFKKIEFWIFFHIYFKARIVRAGLNIALIMFSQYMKRNPAIKLYFSTFGQKQKF